MDSFSVSIATASEITKIKLRQILYISAYIGFFHWLMSFIGGYSGLFLTDILKKVDHWLALIILVVLGSKMIYEAITNKKRRALLFNSSVLFVLALATSIDAFGVGLSYGFFNKSIFLTSAIIGTVAFLFSYLGFFIGKLFKGMLKNKMQLIGGLILIGIGIKIFIDHSFIN